MLRSAPRLTVQMAKEYPVSVKHSALQLGRPELAPVLTLTVSTLNTDLQCVITFLPAKLLYCPCHKWSQVLVQCVKSP